MNVLNGVLVVTSEKECPVYNVGEEFLLEDGLITVPKGKPICIELLQVVTSEAGKKGIKNFNDGFALRCYRCEGNISVKLKQEQSFATPQMKMLATAERVEKAKANIDVVTVIKYLDFFSSFQEEELIDLAILFEIQDYPWSFPIIQKGDTDGRFNIIISGKVDVVDEDGITFAQLGKGNIFGEMGLLSGVPATTTIIASEPCRVAEMSRKNFDNCMKRFPELRSIFYKLMVDRITSINKQLTEEKGLSFSGKIEELELADLCQLINASTKTGCLQVICSEFSTFIYFVDGQIVNIKCSDNSIVDPFLAILKLSHGRFTFSKDIDEHYQSMKPIGDFMEILFKSLKNIDELSS